MKKLEVSVVCIVLLLTLVSACAAPATPTPVPAAPTAVPATQTPTVKKVIVGLSWNEKGQPLVVAWEDYLRMETEKLGKEKGLEFQKQMMMQLK